MFLPSLEFCDKVGDSTAGVRRNRLSRTPELVLAA